jgi:hypothetical protein
MSLTAFCVHRKTIDLLAVISIIVAKLQKELADENCSQSSPYIQAVIHEVQRLANVFPGKSFSLLVEHLTLFFLLSLLFTITWFSLKSCDGK